MSDRVSTSIRVDAETKKQAQGVFKDLGLDFSSGIEIYLKAVARERRIPFDLDLDKEARRDA